MKQRSLNILPWTSLGLCVSLCGIWSDSRYGSNSLRAGRYELGAEKGRVFLSGPSNAEGPVGCFGGGRRFGVGFPMWPLVVATAALPFRRWWDAELERSRTVQRDARANGGQCLRCGYNLTGNVSGVCPACGGATASREVE